VTTILVGTRPATSPVSVYAPVQDGRNGCQADLSGRAVRCCPSRAVMTPLPFRVRSDGKRHTVFGDAGHETARPGRVAADVVSNRAAPSGLRKPKGKRHKSVAEQFDRETTE
jgi:hypothetical protein